LTLTASGIHQPLLLEDAVDLAEMLVRLGRAVPAKDWVDTLLEQQRIGRESTLPHNNV
jgi:hypothetical protein